MHSQHKVLDDRLALAQAVEEQKREDKRSDDRRWRVRDEGRGGLKG